MSTDYVLFLHGVNTREEGFQLGYADHLINLINDGLGSSRKIEPIVPYWGDIGAEADKELLETIKKSPDYEKLWFQDFRFKTLLRFVGDGALYISRYKGAAVVETIIKCALKKLENYDYQTDRLHLVTHSWGTIILFDVLFAARWDEDDMPGCKSVSQLRDRIFGVEPNRDQGIRLASVHTMGSPVGLFYLMDVDQTTDEKTNSLGAKINTHDITPRLERLLESLYKNLGKKLPWCNFVHPGDPIAYPLTQLIPKLVDGKSQFIDIQDIIIHNTTLTDFLTNIVSQMTIALVHGGEAHDSYWQSKEVAQTIVKVIQGSRANAP